MVIDTMFLSRSAVPVVSDQRDGTSDQWLRGHELDSNESKYEKMAVSTFWVQEKIILLITRIV